MTILFFRFHLLAIYNPDPYILVQLYLGYCDRPSIKQIAKQASEELSDYILEAVTQDYSYEDLLARREVPCGRDMYYTAYRRFFWLLSQGRQ